MFESKDHFFEKQAHRKFDRISINLNTFKLLKQTLGSLNQAKLISVALWIFKIFCKNLNYPLHFGDKIFDFWQNLQIRQLMTFFGGSFFETSVFCNLLSVKSCPHSTLAWLNRHRFLLFLSIALPLFDDFWKNSDNVQVFTLLKFWTKLCIYKSFSSELQKLLKHFEAIQ